MNVQIKTFARVVHDYATGPDGRTFALGRGLAVLLFAVGLAIPVAILVIAARAHSTMSDYVALLGALSAYIPALGAAVMALVWGTNPTEPRADPRTRDGEGAQ